MAKLIHKHLGTPVGKHGEIVYKYINKKTFLCQPPENYTPSTSEKYTSNLNLFAELTKFSNFLNKSLLIKQVWKLSKKPGYRTNLKIFKYNHIHVKFFGISSGCKILPESILLNEPGAAMDENHLTIRFKTCDRLGYDIKYDNLKPPLVFMSYIYASDPVDKNNEHKKVNILLEETYEGEPLSQDAFTNYTFDTAENAFSFINDYNTVIVFPAIVSLDKYNCPFKWAECGGIYIKGEHPEIKAPKPPPPFERPGKKFIVQYD